MTSTISHFVLLARHPRVVVTKACEPLDCAAAAVAAVVAAVDTELVAAAANDAAVTAAIDAGGDIVTV